MHPPRTNPEEGGWGAGKPHTLSYAPWHSQVLESNSMQFMYRLCGRWWAAGDGGGGERSQSAVKHLNQGAEGGTRTVEEPLRSQQRRWVGQQQQARANVHTAMIPLMAHTRARARGDGRGGGVVGVGAGPRKVAWADGTAAPVRGSPSSHPTPSPHPTPRPPWPVGRLSFPRPPPPPALGGPHLAVQQAGGVARVVPNVVADLGRSLADQRRRQHRQGHQDADQSQTLGNHGCSKHLGTERPTENEFPGGAQVWGGVLAPPNLAS
jgi:hypothetical protein